MGWVSWVLDVFWPDLIDTDQTFLKIKGEEYECFPQNNSIYVYIVGLNGLLALMVAAIAIREHTTNITKERPIITC